jgi:hypothetical protein
MKGEGSAKDEEAKPREASFHERSLILLASLLFPLHPIQRIIPKRTGQIRQSDLRPHKARARGLDAGAAKRVAGGGTSCRPEEGHVDFGST